VLDLTTAPAPAAGRPLRVGAVRIPPLLAVGLLYLAVSLGLHHRVLGAFTTSTVGEVTADADLFSWWLYWTPWALLHGGNPLFTTYQHYPLGVNGMWNTGTPLLGVLLSPVTLSAGPVAAYNTGMILGPVASGVALAAALGPYVRRWVPRAVAGALYAFGPFPVAHASAGHLNLVWSVLPPVLLYLVHVLFVRGTTRPWWTGALVGAVLAAQAVLYTQTLAFGVLMLVVAAVVLAVRFPGRVRAVLPALVRAGTACVSVFVVLCAYPLYLVLGGPQRPRSTIRDPLYGVADLANLVVPTRLTGLRPVPSGIADQMRANLGEQGGYVGAAVLALLVALVIMVRSTALRLTAAVGAVAFVLSLGPTLFFAGADLGVALPWRLAAQVPLLAEAEPVRLQVVVALCVAVVVALWLDRLPASPWRTWRPVAAVLTALALLTWLPAGAYGARPAPTPVFFTHAAEHLTPTDVVETYPRISSAWEGGARPLRWQAESGMAYRQVGGYFIGSDATHDVLIEAPVNGYQRGAADAVERGGTDVLPVDAAAELRALGVTVVVVVPPPGKAGARVLAWTAAVTGTPGTPAEDAWTFRF
jgi:hypothetical protein